eukprot:m.61210 g.61210  ORF g.61210 m.61210 type:complete len:76 (-) comp11381_c1_seq1:797-1024(-)
MRYMCNMMYVCMYPMWHGWCECVFTVTNFQLQLVLKLLDWTDLPCFSLQVFLPSFLFQFSLAREYSVCRLHIGFL